MKKILVLISLFSTMSIFATQLDTYQLNCKHFAATEIVDTMKITYMKDNNQWSKNALIEINSSWDDIINTDNYVGRLRDDVTNHYIPVESKLVFEPLKGADYDQATIRYTHDDDLGTLAILEYVSDGPVFTQILKCN